jgi:hypothetical protein
MKRYFTVETIKNTLRHAESLGVNTLIARTDYHIMRMLAEYWDQGGAIQWFAQTCPEVGSSEQCVWRACMGQARAVHIHGGVMDHLVANGRCDEVAPAIQMIRDNGKLAGIAGHNPNVFRWAEQHLDVDYYMCCYYDSMRRDKNPEHIHGSVEQWLEEDRHEMTTLIQTLSRPVVHYKVLAAGRNDPAEALAYAARCMRANDTVCVGVFPKDHPQMLAQNVALLHKSLGEVREAETAS